MRKKSDNGGKKIRSYAMLVGVCEKNSGKWGVVVNKKRERGKKKRGKEKRAIYKNKSFLFKILKIKRKGENSLGVNIHPLGKERTCVGVGVRA